MIKKIVSELADGKKTYSVTGFAVISNCLEKFYSVIPTTMPEWTELFNMCAAAGACILVAWRLINKFRHKDKK